MLKKLEKSILEELGSLQNGLRIMDCDLAKILGISNSYLSNIRSHAYVSPYMLSVFKVAVSFFRHIIKTKPTFHVGQRLAESITKFRTRKTIIIDDLRKKFLKTLEAIDKTKG